MQAKQFGFYLAVTGIGLGILYLGAVISAFVFAGGFPLDRGYEVFISAVTYLSVPGIVLLWAAIHQSTPAEKQVFSLGSLALVVIFATLTSINRYNALTVVQQAEAAGQTAGLEWFQPYGWPSIMTAMEVQAWGVYLGLACLCLAPVFCSGRLEKAIFWLLIASGVLCLLAAFGQVIGNPSLTGVGILAWGPGLVAVFACLAAWFRRK